MRYWRKWAQFSYNALVMLIENWNGRVIPSKVSLISMSARLPHPSACVWLKGGNHDRRI